jgi:hypothetical protein
MTRSKDIGSHGDEGFTLTELLVASILGFVMLVAIYLVLETGISNYERLEAQARASRAAGRASEVVARYFREAASLNHAGDDSVIMRGDFDDDGLSEYVTFTYDDATGDLHVGRYDDAGDVPNESLLAEGVVNDAEPVFEYYRFDEYGALVPCGSDPVGDRLSADLVVLRFEVDADENDELDPHVATTQVLLRNNAS